LSIGGSCSKMAFGDKLEDGTLFYAIHYGFFDLC
jgi:hypothetical protein